MSNETMTLKVIAHIHTAFPTKFGIPRQSGLVDGLRGEIIFTPEYRNADALRGLEDFSHIWLVWQFSGAVRESWSPTVRPPRLGGNTRMGVFATRSPFRPNPLGLSSVRLEAIEHRPEVGPVLIVRGADLMDGTPIYDIKPYIPYADCHSDAAAGFTAQTQTHRLQVECPPELWETVPAAGHPLAEQAEVTLQELAGQEFLLTERGMSYRDALDQCMAAQGLAIKPFLELGSASLLCQMVEHGMGLSFLPEYIVQNALAAGTLARLNVPACRVEMRRQLFYHRDKWLTPQMKAFITLVQK